MKKIMITGAGSGLGKGTSIGLAKNGHYVIAAVHLWEQKTVLQEQARELGIEDNLEVIKIDILDSIDRKKAWSYDVDILVNNAGIGETGPVAEIPVDLYRKVMETNVFGTIEFTQPFVKKMVEKGRGKVFFLSSIAGVSSMPNLSPYTASKHALEAVAQSMREEVKDLGITVATINPGVFRTGFNDRMFEAVDQWFDKEKNFTPYSQIQGAQDYLASTDGQYDPQIMIDGMVEVIPQEKHKFRTMLPLETVEFCKEYQKAQWDLQVNVQETQKN